MILISEYMKLPREERILHIDLNQPCVERGGSSGNFKGVLAQYLDTTIPSNGRVEKALVCHACHNGKCSNPAHLYWGSYKDNYFDYISNGGKNGFEKLVDKYGYTEACNKIRPSKEHMIKIRILRHQKPDIL